MMDRRNDIPTGKFRDARPGETIPEHYVSIPIFNTWPQLQRHLALQAMEEAKDVTPRGEVKP